MELSSKSYPELLKEIEGKQLDSFSIIQLSWGFRRALENCEKNSSEYERCRMEAFFFEFPITNGRVGYKTASLNADTSLYQFPNYEHFDDATFEYLIERFETSTNPHLTIHYGTILASSNRQHNKYRRKIIEAYKNQLTALKKVDAEEGGAKTIEIGRTLKNVFGFLRETESDDIEYFNLGLLNTISTYPEKFKYSPLLISNLLLLIQENKKGFRPEEVTHLESIISNKLDFWQTKNYRRDPRMVIQMMQKLCEWIPEWELNLWLEKEAIELERQLNQPSAQLLWALGECRDAISIYKGLGNERKTKELKKKFNEIISKSKLKQVSTEIDVSEIISKSHETIDKHNTDPLELLTFISRYPQFPKPKELETKEGLSLMDIISKIAFDGKGNVVEDTRVDDTYSSSTYTRFRQTMAYGYSFMHEMIFLKGFERNNINADIIYAFLKQTWIGFSHVHTVLGNEKNENYLPLIMPSIIAFFDEVGRLVQSRGRYQENFVLVLDSLTLKFEGLIRILMMKLDLPTFRTNRDGTTGEIYLHEMLFQKEIIELIGADLTFVLRMVLVERKGFNLRNDIGHSLLPFDSYIYRNAAILVILLIKLASHPKIHLLFNSANSSEEE